MAELTDFPPKEQELIKEMLSFDFSTVNSEQRQWEIIGSISSEGLVYAKAHLFDSVFEKIQTDANNAILELENLEKEQQEKHRLAIVEYQKEERARCKYLIAFVCMSVFVAIMVYVWIARF